jgi:hypothetical protein
LIHINLARSFSAWRSARSLGALGISEVHANRMLRRLQNEKLIVSGQRIVRIPDLDALKVAATFDARYLHLDGAPQSVRDALSAQNRVA